MTFPDTKDRAEQRKFGLVMAAAFCVLALIRWGIHWALDGHMTGPPWVLLGIALGFGVLGLVTPPVLRPVMVVWFSLALVLNVVVTRTLLAFVFAAMLVPGRAILIMLGKDPLKTRLDPSAESYWEDAEAAPEDPKRYYDQF